MNRSFTLIEIMIAFAVIAIIASVFLSLSSAMRGDDSVSFGLNGITETRCMKGMEFIVGQDGSTRQVMDEFGKGLRCGSSKESTASE